MSVSDQKVFAPYVRTRTKQCHHGACVGIDARKVRPFVRVAAVTRERQSTWIVGPSVLPRNDMFDMESDQGGRLLRDAAILASVACARSNNW